MYKYTQAIRSYIASSPGRDVVIGVAITVGFIALLAAAALLIHSAQPNVTYQPDAACSLLTREEASEMLGDEIIASNPSKPVLSGNVATTKCSYSDVNPDEKNMMVAAIAVRAGINDKGVQQNKAEFDASRAGKNYEDVKGLGESAYFDHDLGQLNILNGRDWIILSYGIGSAPKTNTVDKAIELAQKVLLQPQLPTF